MRFAPSTRLAVIVALATLILAGLGFRASVGQLNIYLQKEPIPLRAPLATIPASLGAWDQKGEDHTLGAAIVEELGTDQYLDRIYLRSSGGRPLPMSVHLAFYTGMIDAIPHVPDRCWVAGGLVPVDGARLVPLRLDEERFPLSEGPLNVATGQPYRTAELIDAITRRSETVHLPIGEYALRAIEFQSETNPEERLIGAYLFLANGRITPSAIEVRSLAFRPSERYAYFCKLQFAMPASGSDPRRWERFEELANDLFNQLLPQIMRRLPDWPQVEARTASADAS